MTDIFEMAAEFNRHVRGVERPDAPRMLSPELLERFAEAAHEELGELWEANTVEDQADALLDLMYFTAGRLHDMGVDGAACLGAIHAANMKKVRGSKASRPGWTGHDAVKPDGWQAPDLRPLLSHPRLVGPGRDRLEARSRPHPKVLVLGHARHGKDTVAKLLESKYGLSFRSSSMFCAERLVLPALGDRYGYENAEQCFADRGNHRAAWYDIIRDFNSPDAARLGRSIFAEHDVYCGLRSKAEFNALKNTGAFDVSLWVDASDRLPQESASSCTVEPWMADYVLDNNGSVEDLTFNLEALVGHILDTI